MQWEPSQHSVSASQELPSIPQGTMQVPLSQTSPSQQLSESPQSEPAGVQAPTQTPLMQISPIKGQQSVSSAHPSPRSEQTAGTQRLLVQTRLGQQSSCASQA